MIEVGQTIGNYRITAKLGEGGMGVVYLAEHPVIGRKVALKAIHPELSRNPEVVSRFMTEAKSVNQIGNEHIVDVSDFGNTSDGEFYFIMEFLQGESVADRLRRERLFEPHRAMQIAAQVADALHASHTQGIIHRDLKPENIFLINRGQTRDFVKVLDFGLAKLTQGEEKVSHKTRTGSVMGTPYYMSPEQCEGKAGVDFRADIYSLGVILFEMMTGRVPFGGEGYGEIIVKHLTVPPPLPSSFNPTITTEQEAVVMRALSKKREDRFSSMQEFRAAMLDPGSFISAGSLLPDLDLSSPSEPALPVATGRVVSPTGATRGQAPADLRRSSPGGRPSTPGTTLDHGAGELYPEDLGASPRPRRRLVMGALLVVAVAAGAAFAVYKSGQSPAGGAPAATATEVTTPAPPPAARPDVKLSFSSEPAGATVVRQDTGETLGTTPFERPLPSSKESVPFLFRKDGFQEQVVSVAPESAGPVRATLVAVTPPAPVVAAPAAPPTAGKNGRSASSASEGRGRKPAGRSKKATPRKPADEDGVLEPTFR